MFDRFSCFFFHIFFIRKFSAFLWFMFHWLGYHSRHCCRYFFDWHLLHVKLHQAKVVPNVHDTHTQTHTTPNQFVHSIIFIHFKNVSEKKKWEKKDIVASFTHRHTSAHMRFGEHGSNVYRMMVEWNALCCRVDGGGSGGLVKTTEYFWFAYVSSFFTPFIHRSFKLNSNIDTQIMLNGHIKCVSTSRWRDSAHSKISKCITAKLWSTSIQLRIFYFHSETFRYANT